MDDHQRDLPEAVDELAETLETLRTELREPPRGPLGLPRPPTPGEFRRLTEEYTLPALVSLLETSVRVLELLAASIRVAQSRPLDGEDDRPRTDPVVTVSRRTLRGLDDALADLQREGTDGGPADTRVRRLLQEARDLQREVDDRLADSTATPERSLRPTDPEPVEIEVQAGDEGEEDDGGEGVDVDVDRELEDIKRELDEDEFDRAPEPGDEESGGRPGDDADESETQNGS